MISNVVILLTACVNPDGMTKTVLQNCDTRLSQYKEALRFYLTRTSYKIVVVENTLFDFSDNYQSQVNDGRLEYLTFEGNEYDKSLGKGYGEALIIKYAFENSKFINAADCIVKITGRLKVLNINTLMKNIEIIWDKRFSFVACDTLLNQSFAFSQFIFASKPFYLDYFIPNSNKINDMEIRYFEHILAESVTHWKRDGNKHYLFMIPIEVQGVSGTTGIMHDKPPLIKKIGIFIKSIYLNHLSKIKFTE
jgi:hypothetical protein